MALNDDEKLEKYKVGYFNNRFNDRQTVFLSNLVQANLKGEVFSHPGELSQDEARNILRKGWDPKRVKIEIPDQPIEKVSKPSFIGLITQGIFRKPAAIEPLKQGKDQKRESTPPKPK